MAIVVYLGWEVSCCLAVFLVPRVRCVCRVLNLCILVWAFGSCCVAGARVSIQMQIEAVCTGFTALSYSTLGSALRCEPVVTLSKCIFGFFVFRIRESFSVFLASVQRSPALDARCYAPETRLVLW